MRNDLGGHDKGQHLRQGLFVLEDWCLQILHRVDGQDDSLFAWQEVRVLLGRDPCRLLTEICLEDLMNLGLREPVKS